MYNPLLDKEFLLALNQYKHKEVYARIISLNFQEQPMEQIEGRVTGGSVNIDGNSAVRRTCSLTMVAKDVNITDFYWGVSNKFTLEIGLRNFINPIYPDIIWFNQGKYVIASFSSSLTQNNYTISISGKDKMCLLNGDLGGSLHSSIDFGVMDTYTNYYTRVNFTDKEKSDYIDPKKYVANKYYIYEDKEYIIATEEYNSNKNYYELEVRLEQEQLLLKDIIREAVHTYGKEMYHNIVINDLDDYGLELLEYRGDVPLYLLYNEDAKIYENMTANPDDPAGEYTVGTIPAGRYNNAINDFNEDAYKYTTEFYSLATGSFNPNENYYIWVELTKNYVLVPDLTEEEFNKENIEYYTLHEEQFSVTKLEMGDEEGLTVAGYRTTDLVYAGDLISSIGESLTSILDKIKNMLGAFEYFYDLDGRFIFQAKKVYANQSWNTLINSDGNVFARDAIEESQYSYSFDDVNLIQKFQNTPAINNVKNDYSIWGTRKGASGAEIPIHARYAIHEKPKYYKSFDGIIYYSDPDLLDAIKDREKIRIEAELNDRIQNFVPQYEPSFTADMPIRLPDGSYTAGWWDIRDWYEYYHALKQEYPNGTMKFYSYNSPEGAYRVDSIPELTYYYQKAETYHWMLIENASGYLSLGHGGGSPYDRRYDYVCTFYDYNPEDLDEEGKVLLNKTPVKWPKKDNFGNIQYDENGNVIYTTMTMIGPFSGCTDTHTFDYFMKNYIERGQKVYFYNPKFPDAENFEEAIDNQVDKEFDEMILNGELKLVDWREIIYQMAKDYYKHNQEINFTHMIAKNNQKAYKKDNEIFNLFINGETGYEMFYEDIQGFWRELYNPEPDIEYETSGGYYEEVQVHEQDENGNELETYRVETQWTPFKREEEVFYCDYFLKSDTINDENYSTTKYYWNKNVVNAPDLLNYWLDFYEGNDMLQRFSISAIGDRPKVENNSKITSIYFRSIPQIIFISSTRSKQQFERKTGYTYITLDETFEPLFTISAQGKSAQDTANELMNKYSYCSEAINISLIPIYDLEPNSIIYIYNQDTGINGKYQVNKITLPLTYNGMMSITGTKIIDTIY